MQVSDADLEYLKGLSNLQELSLVNTQVTGAGFEHLKGLTGLRTLNIRATRSVTKASSNSSRHCRSARFSTNHRR